MSPKKCHTSNTAETGQPESPSAILDVSPEVFRDRLARLGGLGIGPAELREVVLSPQERLSKKFTPGHARFPKDLMPDTAVTNQLGDDYSLVAGPAYAEAEPGLLAPKPETAQQPPRIIEGIDGSTQSLN